MTDIQQKHAIDVQLLSIKCGALYGALAFAGLIVSHVVWGNPFGALAAIAGATLAYVNFSATAAGAREAIINGSMLLSIAAGIASGVMLIAEALG